MWERGVWLRTLATFPKDLDSIPSSTWELPATCSSNSRGSVSSYVIIWLVALHACGAYIRTCRQNTRTNINNKILEKVSALSAHFKRVFVLLVLNFQNLKRVAEISAFFMCVTCVLLDSMEVIMLFRVNRLLLVRTIHDYFNKFSHKYAQILRILLSLMPGIVNC